MPGLVAFLFLGRFDSVYVRLSRLEESKGREESGSKDQADQEF
jgi:hypothetical protein